MTTTLKWLDRDSQEWEAAQARRLLLVDDGTLTHAAVLPDDVTPVEGLRSYAAGYDAGEHRGEIVVGWELRENGQTTQGKWSFTP
jgi:hypothetical protein